MHGRTSTALQIPQLARRGAVRSLETRHFHTLYFRAAICPAAAPAATDMGKPRQTGY
ncbi:hypothetical protein SPHINGOT1_110035 [Sphingomonas sp. T1]|nr:hypothetical protein SPHINGOT1_110035 [Sphingomonas sp. T1]